MSNNSPENRKARREYRLYYESQPADIQAQLPVPEREEDISGMDGNWVFPVDEAMASHTDADASFAYYDDATHTPATSSQAGEHNTTGRVYSEDEMQEVVRRVVLAMQLSESPDVLFHARCILIALGIGDPPKESELARLKGCSRQFVSKKVKRIQQLFNLSPSQFMRSEQACKAYARAYHKHRSPSPRTGHKKSITDSITPLGNRHLRQPEVDVDENESGGKV